MRPITPFEVESSLQEGPVLVQCPSSLHAIFVRQWAEEEREMRKSTPVFGLFLVFAALFAVLVLAPGQGQAARKATIQESKELIRTYPFSDPDPVPILARSGLKGREPRLYPYFFFDGYSADPVEHEWTVVRLENPYIEVSVLPEVGGKVWGAREKSTGQEFIYTNKVLKFRQIALRGPWTSGGIEFNFGIMGHAPSTATPVDYLTRKNPDGSVTCVVGALDLPSRTRWSVAVRVPRDKAYFETKPFWYNPYPLDQPYYVWMNSAVRTGDDLQYVSPGRSQIGHDFSVPLRPWPVDDKGRDLSLYRNNNFGPSKSYFTVGEYEDFSGGYWLDKRFGFGHWARYDDMPGHKVWIWALSREGGIWENLLTDTDGQYSEPQTGRYLNQSDQEFFAPYCGDAWREIWFPYKEIGPMVKASPTAALHVSRTGQSLTIGLCPLGEIREDLVVFWDGKEQYREPLRLKPMQVYKKTLYLSETSSGLGVCVGRELVWTSDSGANDVEKPILFRDYREETTEGVFLQAERDEKGRQYSEALPKYLEVVRKEPRHTRALCRTAGLYYRRGEYGKALAYAAQGLENEMYDPASNYVYGVIARRLGRMTDAKEALGWAARSMEFRSAAYCEMAEILLGEKRLDEALEYARRSLEFNRYNINALQAEAIALRKQERPREARGVLEEILAIEPLNHFARFERYLLDPKPAALAAFQSPIQNELPHETYLEIAVYYAGLRQWDEAVEVLRNAPEHPTVYYWLAYLLKDTSLAQSRDYLLKAGGMSPYLVFPFREESIDVFRWAMGLQPDEWKPRYYLGLIYWSKGRTEEALGLLESCGEAEFAPLRMARGFLNKREHPDKALADFEAARKLEPESWRTWHLLIQHCAETRQTDKALALAKDAAGVFRKHVGIQADLVGALMAAKQYDEALRVLDGMAMLPFEGAREMHRLYVTCQTTLALKDMKGGDFAAALQHIESSKTYPERLGTGKPYDPDHRMQDYLLFLCYEKTGDKQKAVGALRSVRQYTIEHPDAAVPGRYFGNLALKRLGEESKAPPLRDEDKPSQEVMDILETLK